MVNSTRIGACEKKGCGQRGRLLEIPLKSGRVVSICLKCLEEIYRASPRESKEGHYTQTIATP